MPDFVQLFEDELDEQTKYECGVVPRYPLRAEVSCACVYKGRLDVTAKVIKRVRVTLSPHS
jgi:hypothetical protein